MGSPSPSSRKAISTPSRSKRCICAYEEKPDPGLCQIACAAPSGSAGARGPERHYRVFEGWPARTGGLRSKEREFRRARRTAREILEQSDIAWLRFGNQRLLIAVHQPRLMPRNHSGFRGSTRHDHLRILSAGTAELAVGAIALGSALTHALEGGDKPEHRNEHPEQPHGQIEGA